MFNSKGTTSVDLSKKVDSVLNAFKTAIDGLNTVNTQAKAGIAAKEEEIMQMFWEHGPMFVRELLAFYEEPKPHYNTVSTLVRGLEEKGFVKYKAYGNTYQYYAAVSDKEYKRSALNDVVAQYYNNSYTNVVSTFIEEEGMSVDELKALIAEIESKKSNR